MTRRELEQAMVKEMERLGITDHRFDRMHRHPRLCFCVAGVELYKSYSGSPSDRGPGLHRLLADIRRMVRQARGATLEADASDSHSLQNSANRQRRRRTRRARRLSEIPQAPQRPDPFAALAALLPMTQRKES